jgi:flagellar motility protein MotE (MotC chaperone)
MMSSRGEATKPYQAFERELPNYAKKIAQAKTNEERIKVLKQVFDKSYKLAKEFDRARREELEKEIEGLTARIRALERRGAVS